MYKQRLFVLTAVVFLYSFNLFSQVQSEKNIIEYRKYHISNSKKLDSIKSVFQDTNSIGLKVLTTLNRKELRFFRVGQDVVLPTKIGSSILDYSLFPDYYPAAKDIPKIIIMSNKYQCYACYEFGKIVRFAAVNSGKESTPTYPGRYSVQWRDKKRRSSLDSTWVMPFTVNYHKYAGSAFHQFEMPGRPVSHSCARQFLDDAEWLFHWVDLPRTDKITNEKKSGAPVIILDVFDYSRKKGGPWLELISNIERPLQLPDNPMQVEEALIPIKQIPKESRGSLPNKKRYETAEDTLRARGVIRPTAKIKESVNFGKLRKEKEKKKLEALKKEQEGLSGSGQTNSIK